MTSDVLLRCPTSLFLALRAHPAIAGGSGRGERTRRMRSWPRVEPVPRRVRWHPTVNALEW